MAMRIKTLLYDEGYTIPGARQAFKTEAKPGKDVQLGLAGVVESVDTRPLLALQKNLRDLHALLLRPVSSKPAGPAVQPIRAPRPLAVKPAPTAPVPFPKPLAFAPKARPAETTESLFNFDPPRQD